MAIWLRHIYYLQKKQAAKNSPSHTNKEANWLVSHKENIQGSLLSKQKKIKNNSAEVDLDISDFNT